MSTVTPPRALFEGWIDDAAMFPPAQLPADQALREHLQLRDGPHADLIGPLLTGTTHAPAFVEAAASAPPSSGNPVPMVVIARAGTPVTDLLDAATTIRGSAHLRLVGAEITAADPEWTRALKLGMPLAVEVTTDALDAGLDAVQRAARDGHEVIAKLRTQAVPPAGAPTPAQLAAFLTGTRERGLSFKLTGGLHHALPHGNGASAEHGLLNVLAAAGRTIPGATDADLVDLLTTPDPRPLAATITGWDNAAIEDVRRSFRSFGCCAVLDPIGELTDLGLLATRSI